MSDPTRIRQILINIVGNAIKFTQHGGVTIEVALINQMEVSPNVRIIVKDTGIGLTKEQAQRLFQPFMQADNSTTRKYGGTGLGLALSKRLANALGGDVTVEERATEKGATFVFTFQATIAEPNPKKTKPILKTVDIENSELPLADISVLLADDSPDNRELNEYILGKCGAHVESATNGMEALNLGLTGSHDIILIDIQMPVMDGYEATRSLRLAGYKKPIIALTAHAMAEERAQTLAAGCDGHLTKPINQIELVKTIRSATLGRSKTF